MELTNIIVAVLTFIFGAILTISLHRKNKQLSEKNLELSQRLLKLENEKFNYQITQDAQKELAQEIAERNKIKEVKSHTQLYREHIIEKFQYLDFTGLNALLQKPLKLERIYVKLKTRPQRENNTYKTIEDFEQLAQEDSNIWHEKEALKASELTDILNERIKQAQKDNSSLKMLILGHPGSGKTTLMKWIALQCVGQKIRFLADNLPVFIALKDLGKDPEGTFRTLGIEKLVKKQIEHENLSSKFFDRHYKKNEVIFLLDGLDEVADETIRKEVIDWIQKQNIRKNTLIITSRFSGIQAEKGLKFHDAWPVFCIKDFDLEDIKCFLKNWYQNVEKAMAENSEAKALKKANDRCESLIETIKSEQHKKLRELAVNPLLLTIIAIVHRTRAVLPKERHKLYEECVKVMIELWNVANKKLNINFSVDNSINYLSKIAVYLMKENLRETSLKIIEDILPSEIENQSVSFFLEEMILKAGLLYKSEGQYGFLHLTFQEYLTAWNFSKRSNPEEILEYRDKDYWTETFKLFANISNTRHFFNTVLERLEPLNYYQEMPLWEDCLQDIALEDTKQELEVKFAKHILNCLIQLGCSEIDEDIINYYYTHYPIYKHAEKFTLEAWNLFSNPQHPFVQSVGATLLSLCDHNTRGELVTCIKYQIDEIVKLSTLTHSQAEEFAIRHNVSFFLLLVTREKLMDFSYILDKLKVNFPFATLLILRDLRSLRDTKVITNLKGHHEFNTLQDHSDRQDLRVLRYLRDTRDLFSLSELLRHVDDRYLKDRRDLRDIQDFRYIRDLRDLRELKELRNLKELSEISKEYYHKYETRIQENKDRIEIWADLATDILHGMPDENLLEYFPGTTEDELKAFREDRDQS